MSSPMCRSSQGPCGTPASSCDNCRVSVTSRSSRAVCRMIISRNSPCRGSVTVLMPRRVSAVEAMMANGVRSSCDALATSSRPMVSARRASVMSRNTRTTPFVWPGPAIPATGLACAWTTRSPAVTLPSSTWPARALPFTCPANCFREAGTAALPNTVPSCSAGSVSPSNRWAAALARITWPSGDSATTPSPRSCTMARA